MQGFDTQGMWFWLKAADLYLNENVESVGYEVDEARGFDDVAVYYRDPDPVGVQKEFYQIKFRIVAGDPFTCDALTDPAFINASKISLFQRLRDVQREHAPAGTEARFIIAIPTSIDPRDKLAELVEKTDGRLLLDKLMKGGRRSGMGGVRECWKEHLGIETDEELRRVLMPLRIIEASTMSQLRESASQKLRLAGWKPYDEATISSRYDDLPRKLLQEGQTRFTKEELTRIGRREGLWVSPPVVGRPVARKVGIRSFGRGTETMGDEQDAILCLLDHFDGRWPVPGGGWNEEILPAVRAFLNDLPTDAPVHLELRGHNTVAFGAGYVLDSKAGVEVYPVQIGGGRQVWQPLTTAPAEDQLWKTDVIEVGDGPELALTISVTHDIAGDVLEHARDHVPEVGRVITLGILPQPSSTAVRDGTHAFQLAQSAIAAARAAQATTARGARVHLFAAAPACLLFFIGQHARVLGPCCIYEHDFDRVRPLAYERSGIFPHPNGA